MKFSFFAIPGIMILLVLGGISFSLYSLNLLIDLSRGKGLTDIRQIEDDLIKEEASSGADGIVYQPIAVNQSRIISGRVVIIDMDSYLLADSDRGYEKISGQFINAELSDAKNRSYVFSTTRGKTPGDITVTVAGKISLRSEDVVVSISYKVAEAGQFLGAVSLFFVYLALLLTGLGFLIVSVSHRRYQEPIRSLLKSTADAARGGIYKINVDTTSEELSQLVENFNTLVDRFTLLTASDNKKYSRFNTLLSNLKTGILMVDRDNSIKLVNPRAEEMLNLNKLKLFNVRDRDDYRNSHLEEVLGLTARVNRNREPALVTLTNTSGQILDVSVEAVFNKYSPYEHNGALVILRDVTEMRRLEKLKDDFVANVSHELRTPLTLINGFVETLKTWDLLTREDRNTALNIIELETERLKKLINELLLLSRIEGGMTEASRGGIDPVSTVEEVMAALEPFRREKGIVLVPEIRSPLPSLYGVVSWFRQIVFNLYHNALKYTPEGGQIIIRLGTSAGAVVLEVSDNGIGISPEEQVKIFDRFYRIEKYKNRKISGSGLGLTITRQMVLEFGGTIEVDSTESAGSTFRVTIPLKEDNDPGIES